MIRKNININFFKLVKHCEGVETEELYFVHRSIYEYFVAELKRAGISRVETGKFGADMKVSLINDGPVTIILDSEELK